MCAASFYENTSFMQQDVWFENDLCSCFERYFYVYVKIENFNVQNINLTKIYCIYCLLDFLLTRHDIIGNKKFERCELL